MGEAFVLSSLTQRVFVHIWCLRVISYSRPIKHPPPRSTFAGKNETVIWE
jgi:hypothetical protein